MKTFKNATLVALLVLATAVVYPIWVDALPTLGGRAGLAPHLESFSAFGPVKLGIEAIAPVATEITPEANVEAAHGFKARVGRADVGFFDRRTKRAGVLLQTGQARLEFYLRGSENSNVTRAAGREIEFGAGETIIRYTLTADRVKENILLKKPPPTSTWLFDYREEGLHRRRLADGGFSYLDDRGLEVLRMPAPMAVDARGRIGKAWLEIKGDVLTLTVDPAWLRTAAYPVAVDPAVICVTGGIAGTGYPINRKLVKATTGAMVLFYQSGADLAYRVSTDTGMSWSGAYPLANSTRAESSVVMDKDNHIYAVYSDNGIGDYIYFKKLTYSGTDTWTVGPKLTVATDTLSRQPAIWRGAGGRLWVSYRINDAKTSIRYSDDDGVSWSAPADLGGSHAAGSSVIVRYKGHPAVIFEETSTTLAWRYFNGSSWSASQTVAASTGGIEDYAFSAVATNDDRLHVVFGDGAAVPTAVRYTYLDGGAWAAPETISAAPGDRHPQITTDGKDLWTFYSQFFGRNQYKTVYKARNAGVWDASATAVNQTWEREFNQVWVNDATAWSDETTDAATVAPADVPIFKKKKGVVYTGSTERFDYIYFDLAVNSDVDIAPTWEYWNGSAWAPLTITENPGYGFTSSGNVRFGPPVDWAATSVNGGPAYYYIRATGNVNAGVQPVATQITAVKNNAYPTTLQKGNDVIAVAWSEGNGPSWNLMFAPFAVSTITMTIDSTFNRNGTSGSNSVDFGQTAPYESPFIVHADPDKHAVKLTVGSSLRWDLFTQAAGDLDAGGGKTIPIDRLNWRTHDSTEAWTAFQATPDKILADQTPVVDGILRHDYRLTTTWDDDPGTYSTVITYTVLPSP